LYNESNAALLGYNPKDLKNKKPLDIPLEMELSIIAVGDANSDSYPLQVLDFKKHDDLARDINKIFPEGRGDGSKEESYELAMYYLLHHCETPKARNKPICVIFGDEAYYDKVSRIQVRDLIGDELDHDLDSRDVIKKLYKKFEVYVLRPEISYSKEEYAEIHKKWTDVLPEENVMKMVDPEAIVNCIILVCGKATGHDKQALDMLERREEQWEIDQALEAVHPNLKKEVVK
jgi:hypothetical protein